MFPAPSTFKNVNCQCLNEEFEILKLLWNFMKWTPDQPSRGLKAVKKLIELHWLNFNNFKVKCKSFVWLHVWETNNNNHSKPNFGEYFNLVSLSKICRFVNYSCLNLWKCTKMGCFKITFYLNIIVLIFWWQL